MFIRISYNKCSSFILFIYSLQHYTARSKTLQIKVDGGIVAKFELTAPGSQNWNCLIEGN